MRHMAIGDIPDALAFWRSVPGMGMGPADRPEALEAFLRINGAYCFVEADENGALIGTALCGCDGRRGYLYHVAVTPALRGHGHGTRLVNASLEALRASGIDKVHLFVFKDNDVGKRYWSGSGWTLREDINVFSMNI